MKKPLRHANGRRMDGHDYEVDADGFGMLSTVPIGVHRADAFRNRATHADRDVPTKRRKRHA